MTAPVVASCWICADEPPERRCGGFGCWSAPMPRLSREQLKGLSRPRLCVVCESRPALVGDGKNECDKCDPHPNDHRYVKAFGKGYGHDKDAASSLYEEQMEANGSALEGSVRTAGGGLSRGWAGARLSDYEVGNDD